jgi:hypothetical protein
MTDLVTTFVHFRVFAMPCCGANICWVNPRLPNYCPECGAFVYAKLKMYPTNYVLFSSEAQLKHPRDVVAEEKWK